MSFIESRLLTKVAYGFSGGATFQTTRVKLYSGYVARNAERSMPLYRYSAPYNALSLTDHAIVVAAFNACLGGVHGFRFKDHSDYSATGEVIGTGTGATDQTLQLTKTYTFGSTSLVRTIKKPVAGTVQLYEDGSPLSSTVDTTTGIVTFTSSAASPNVTITADFQFDVPVMFADDDLSFSYVEKLVQSTEINLVEDLSA